MKALAFHLPLFRPVPRLRLAAAVLVLAAALAGAMIVHGVRVARPACPAGVLCAVEIHPFIFQRPGWADPAAVALLVLGAAGAVGFLVIHRRSD
jgi:hypothetical protein